MALCRSAGFDEVLRVALCRQRAMWAEMLRRVNVFGNKCPSVQVRAELHTFFIQCALQHSSFGYVMQLSPVRHTCPQESAKRAVTMPTARFDSNRFRCVLQRVPARVLRGLHKGSDE